MVIHFLGGRVGKKPHFYVSRTIIGVRKILNPYVSYKAPPKKYNAPLGGLVWTPEYKAPHPRPEPGNFSIFSTQNIEKHGLIFAFSTFWTNKKATKNIIFMAIHFWGYGR